MPEIKSDWQYNAIRLGFGLAVLLLSITLGLVGLTYNNLKTENATQATFNKVAFDKLETLIEAKSVQQQTLLSKQSDKVDALCLKLDKHDSWLRVPFDTRQKYFLKNSPKEMGQ